MFETCDFKKDVPNLEEHEHTLWGKSGIQCWALPKPALGVLHRDRPPPLIYIIYPKAGVRVPGPETDAGGVGTLGAQRVPKAGCEGARARNRYRGSGHPGCPESVHSSLIDAFGI